VRASHDLSGVTTTFDESNLVPNAGLLPAAVLAQRIDLAGLVDQRLHLAKHGANSGTKALTVIGSMLLLLKLSHPVRRHHLFLVSQGHAVHPRGCLARQARMLGPECWHRQQGPENLTLLLVGQRRQSLRQQSVGLEHLPPQLHVVPWCDDRLRRLLLPAPPSGDRAGPAPATHRGAAWFRVTWLTTGLGHALETLGQRLLKRSPSLRYHRAGDEGQPAW